MPSCVVKCCKNNSGSHKKQQGITFHRFPKGNDTWQNDWIEIIRNCRGENDWVPSRTSVICSTHFERRDLYCTKSGRRHLVSYAVPKLLLFHHSNIQEEKVSESNTSITVLQAAPPPPLPIEEHTKLETIRKKVLQEALKKKQIAIEIRKRKIKTLKQKVRRLEIRNKTLKDVLKNHYVGKTFPSYEDFGVNDSTSAGSDCEDSTMSTSKSKSKGDNRAAHNDTAKLSWQNKEVIYCEQSISAFKSEDLAVANISQEQSMYADDKTVSAVTDADNNPGYICSECKNIIIGGRITCVQCVSYDLCAVCASEQNAIEHCDHYLLRVPPHRPPDEVQMVLQAVRSLLDNAKADVEVTPPDTQIEYIKPEVKLEFEAYDDPLSTKVETQDSQTQKRAAPIVGTEDEIPQYMYKKIKAEPIDEESTLTEVTQTQKRAAPIVGTEDKIPQYMYKKIKEEAVDEESTLTEVPVQDLANEQDGRRLQLIVAPVKLTSNARDSPNEMSECVTGKRILDPVPTQIIMATCSSNIRQIESNPKNCPGDSKHPESFQNKSSMLPVMPADQMRIHKHSQVRLIGDERKPKVIYSDGLNQSVPKIVHGTSKNTDLTQIQNSLPSRYKQSWVDENMQNYVVVNDSLTATNGNEDDRGGPAWTTTEDNAVIKKENIDK